MSEAGFLGLLGGHGSRWPGVWPLAPPSVCLYRTLYGLSPHVCLKTTATRDRIFESRFVVGTSQQGRGRRAAPIPPARRPGRGRAQLLPPLGGWCLEHCDAIKYVEPHNPPERDRVFDSRAPLVLPGPRLDCREDDSPCRWRWGVRGFQCAVVEHFVSASVRCVQQKVNADPRSVLVVICV